MTAVIFLVTIGGIMIYSALEGISVTDVLKGVVTNPLDPRGGYKSHEAGYSVGSDGTIDLPGGSKYGFQGPHPDILEGLAQVAQSQFNLTITSVAGGTHVPTSYHYRHRAFDAAGSASDMAAFFDFVASRFGATVAELFYDPKGAIKNGKAIPPVGDHSDHVHVAI